MKGQMTLVMAFVEEQGAVIGGDLHKITFFARLI